MRAALRHILLLTLAVCAAAVGRADDATDEPHDTLAVYLSWEAILDRTPDEVLIDPDMAAFSPFDIVISFDDDDIDQMLEQDAVAVAIGDTTWLVSTRWMQDNFAGSCRRMEDWVPLYFTTKSACVVWAEDVVGRVDWSGGVFTSSFDGREGDIYVIDFDRRRVESLDHKVLSRLLAAYPDLLVRYRGMADYKKSHVVNYFYTEYLNRLLADDTVPTIIER